MPSVSILPFSSFPTSVILFKYVYLLVLAVLGPPSLLGATLVVEASHFVASPVAEHRLQGTWVRSCGSWAALGTRGSVVQSMGWLLLCTWDLPWTRDPTQVSCVGRWMHATKPPGRPSLLCAATFALCS